MVLANRYASFRDLRVFYNWLALNYDIPNPLKGIRAPILGKPILPSLTLAQVKTLIEACPNTRDKAIAAFLTESGLRLSELTNIKLEDIDWKVHIVKVMGKGRKEAYALFG